MPDEKPLIIRRYANRRLYDSRRSSHIVLNDLLQLSREGVDFQVIDVSSGADITRQILGQIVVGEESHGHQMLPNSFLRQLISMYGDSAQAVFRLYLQATIDNFQLHQDELEKAWTEKMIPGAFAHMADTGVKTFEAAAAARLSKLDAAHLPATPCAIDMNCDKEATRLRNQIAEMQKELDDFAGSQSDTR